MKHIIGKGINTLSNGFVSGCLNKSFCKIALTNNSYKLTRLGISKIKISKNKSVRQFCIFNNHDIQTKIHQTNL